MTILHISAVKNWGGGENHIETLCYELKQSNPEIRNIVLCVEKNLFHQRLEETQIEFVTAPLAYNLDLRYSLKIIALCKNEKVDIIHIHDPSAIALAILADKFSNLPPFIFSKKTSFPIKDKKLTLYKYNYHKIKKYLCVSEETRRITLESIKVKDKVSTVYQGTSITNKSSETDFLLRERFAIDKSKKIVGIIGNHIRAKNLETFIETVNLIVNVKKRMDIIFVQIGCFTNRTDDLKTRVQELKLENYIHFLGYVPNASNFIPQFDALLMTSQSEGIPEVIFESFYHKKPVISTNVGGIAEILEDEVNGLLTAKQNPEMLAEKIIYLFNNKELEEKFVTLSYEKLISNYSASVMAQKTLKEYKNILNGN